MLLSDRRPLHKSRNVVKISGRQIIIIVDCSYGRVCAALAHRIARKPFVIEHCSFDRQWEITSYC